MQNLYSSQFYYFLFSSTCLFFSVLLLRGFHGVALKVKLFKMMMTGLEQVTMWLVLNMSSGIVPLERNSKMV